MLGKWWDKLTVEGTPKSKIVTLNLTVKKNWVARGCSLKRNKNEINEDWTFKSGLRNTKLDPNVQNTDHNKKVNDQRIAG